MGKRRKPLPPKRPAPKGRELEAVPRWLPGAVIVVVVGIAIAIFVLTRPSPAPPRPSPTGSAAVDLMGGLAGIPVSELDQVGKGTASSSRFSRVSESPLRADGKPELLYIGAEYCPYCAGERWALIVALSRFGTFAGVSPITSSEGNLPTFTFHGAGYTSDYLVYRPVEAADAKGNALDKPTAAESALEQKYASGIPFVDFGNRVSFDGATYDVSALQGLSWEDVLLQLNQSGSAQAQGILGSANLITAGICQLTGQQPGAVCSDPVIQGLEKQLPS
jgi:Domain of unknown function (DUF929)